MVYNPDGTLGSHTDFNGNTRTFEYDDARRLTRRAYAGGSEVTFTCTTTGQRASVSDSRGTTSYTYDDRDRLIEKTDPTGHKLGYAYDLQGNRSSFTATVGAQGRAAENSLAAFLRQNGVDVAGQNVFVRVFGGLRRGIDIVIRDSRGILH